MTDLFTIVKRTFDIEPYEMRLELSSRKECLKVALARADSVGHTYITNHTPTATRNRTSDGRFTRGWQIRFMVVPLGQWDGFGPAFAYQEPNEYYHFYRKDPWPNAASQI